MKRLVCALLVIVLTMSLPVSAAGAEALPLPVAPERVGEEIERFVSEHESTTAGLAVAVFDREGIVYQNYFGYMDRAAGLEVNGETVFEWGSVTKLLVWVSVMQLWEQGSIRLDADIRTYLPDGFLKNLRYEQPVTMLHLMNHNAGFEESIVGMLTTDARNVISLEEYLTQTQPVQVFAPGEVTAYSNWGVTLAGYIVERISGMPFYRYVQERIFEPLGMEHSALNTDLSDNPWVQSRRGQLECYTAAGELIPGCVNYFNCYPAGMCTSTLDDLTVFASALLNRESPLFSDPATWDTMLTPTAWFPGTEIPMNCHGLWALVRYGTAVLGHGGNTTGCSSNLLLDVENGTGMVVMTNQGNEMVYNHELPELVFGTCRHEPLDYSGYVITARTVYHGPLKLYQLLGTTRVMPEDLEGILCVQSTCGDTTKLTVPHGLDYMTVSLPELLLRCSPLLLWVTALLFCLVSLLAMTAAGVVRKLRRRPRILPLRRWAVCSCLAVWVPLIPAVPAVLSLLVNDQWLRWQYQAVFSLFLIFGVVYVLLIVAGIRKMWRRRKWDAFHGAVLAALLLCLDNICYWETGLFWLL